MNQLDNNGQLVSAENSVSPDVPEQSRIVRSLKVRFTGKGGDYFKIWLVNMLLLMVTLGLYYPWAKVRRLKYFYGNTVVGGYPLGFHGRPNQMFKGFLIAAAFFLVYSLLTNFWPVIGNFGFLVLMAFYPLMLRSSRRFSMANTSWRGLRFWFLGDIKGAYQATLPGFALIALLVLAFPIFKLLGLSDNASALDPMSPAIAVVAMLFGGLTVLVAFVWIWWRLRAWVQGHYAWAGLTTQFKGTFGQYGVICLKTLLVGLVALSPLWIAIALAAASGQSLMPSSRGFIPALGLLTLLPIFIWLIALPASMAYYQSQVQNFVWNKTGGVDFRFRSELGFKALWFRLVVNGILVAITFGLYWPFAAVALAKLKLEACRFECKFDVDHMQTVFGNAKTGTLGDAAGDMFDLDLGL